VRTTGETPCGREGRSSLGRVFAVAVRQGKALRTGHRSARGVAQDVPLFTAARLERRAGALTETGIRLNLSVVVRAIPGLKIQACRNRRSLVEYAPDTVTEGEVERRYNLGMALKIIESTLQGVSRDTHPSVFQGIEAISGEFPDGWYVLLIPGNCDSLELRLKAECRDMLSPEIQTSHGVQSLLRKLREQLIQDGDRS